MCIYFTLLINFFVYLNFHVREYLLHELLTWLNFIYLNSMFNFQQLNNPNKKKYSQPCTLRQKIQQTTTTDLSIHCFQITSKRKRGRKVITRLWRQKFMAWCRSVKAVQWNSEFLSSSLLHNMKLVTTELYMLCCS